MVRPGRSWLQISELVAQLVLKDLRVRYKSSFLGYLWAVANPLAFATVFYVAFGLILQRGADENFGVYLITGLFPWAWLAASLVQAAGVYRANAPLVRRVDIPRAVLPLASVLQEMLHFLFAVPILLVAVGISTGGWHAGWIVAVPAFAVVQVALVFPIGVSLAAVNVLVRDVEHLVGVGLQMLFFLTPIVYRPEMVPEEFRVWFALNPFVPLLAGWREALYHGRVDLALVLRCLAFATAAAAIALPAHRWIVPRVGERI